MAYKFIYNTLGAFVLGLAFAAGWTPCNGPILAGILTLAAREADLGRSLYLMGAYSIGLGLPFLLSAIFITKALALMERIKPHLRKVEIVMGLFLILVGVMMFTGSFSIFQGWMLDVMEQLGIPLPG